MRNFSTKAAVALAGTLCLLAAGCRVDENKDGGHENVKIATPFGGMSVKTNDTSVMEGIGLPAYPGAEIVHKKGKDDGAADVNMSFGSFQLRVKAASYRTPDAPDKVQAFYRKALGRFGAVIDCVDNHAVGEPAATTEGLTCENNRHGHGYSNDGVSGKHELKAGSEQHQHIVAVDPDGGGTRFGLIALDLPTQFTDHGKTREDKAQ